MKSSKKIVIMAGGTGGHVIPALEVAKELRQLGYDIHWLGTQAGIESRLVPKQGFPLHFLSVRGLRGKRILSKLMSCLSLLKALMQSFFMLRKLNPVLVIGMGGYASGPGGIAAFLLRIPLLVHEQNAVAGTTNRYLSKVARKVLAAFPGAFPSSVAEVVVGNPIRETIDKLNFDKSQVAARQGECRILVLGGSRGALSINKIMPDVAVTLPTEQFSLWHQVGEHHYQETVTSYEKGGIEARVDQFIDDISEAYQWADIIICRAGAMTVFEVMHAGAAVVFIPFPYAIDDHQTKNAMYLVEREAAMLLPHDQLSVDTLGAMLTSLIADTEGRVMLAVNANKAIVRGSTQKITECCLEVVSGKSN